jgi:hypothetical protein
MLILKIMKTVKIKYVAFLSILLVAGACHDLDELNIDPNGAAPQTTDLNLLLPTAITDLGQNVVNLGFGDIAGVMQHTQKNGWSGGHNDYDWNVTSKSWGGFYGVLRNADEIYNKAVAQELEFHQGVALVLKAYAFGLIADLWGDAPYSQALKAEEGAQFFKPVYDSQQDIYHGILADLETANTLLSKDASEYKNIIPDQDLLYHGDPAKWRQFANSLALRYYMRLQAKEGSFAQAGIEKITSDPATYPVITSASDDANVGYAGTSPETSWPTNMVYNTDPLGEYMRRKMCSTLVETLQALDDPRLGVWAEKVAIPLVLVTGQGEDIDRIVNGKREISPDVAQDYVDRWSASGETLQVDYDPEYVGVPPSTQAAQFYNLTPNLNQGSFNPHVSQLSEMYKETNGTLLQMRLMSAAETHFILAEAALYGWAPGAPEDHYADGIRESFNAWGVGNQFDQDYLAGAPYNGLESIIEQKWIASWTAAAEAWFDYRRTGLPDLQTGPSAKRVKLPLRFYYHADDEISRNTENATVAIDRLEATPYLGTDQSKNSAWSKTWLLQGTGKPY